MRFTDHYMLLGLQPDARADEIKNAYRKLSKKFHPDVNENDPFFAERFKDLQRAYEVLSSRQKRARFDREYFFFHQQATATRFRKSRREKFKPVFFLIPVMIIAAAIFFSETSARRALPEIPAADHEPVFINESHNLTDTDSLAAGAAGFSIGLHEYSSFDTARTTYVQLLKYGYNVKFAALPRDRFQILMHFRRPLADTAIVRDSLSGLFATTCRVYAQ